MLFSHVYPDAVKFKADWTSYTTLLGVNNHTPFKTDNTTSRLISIDGLYSAFLYFFNTRPIRLTNDNFKLKFWLRIVAFYSTFYYQQLALVNNDAELLKARAERDGVNYVMPEGETIQSSVLAATQAGQLTSTSPFSFGHDKLSQKTFNQSKTSFSGRKTTTHDDDLYLNIVKIANTAINFRLQDFLNHFNSLVKQMYAFRPPGLEINPDRGGTPAPIHFKINTDTLEWKSGKLNVKAVDTE